MSAKTQFSLPWAIRACLGAVSLWLLGGCATPPAQDFGRDGDVITRAKRYGLVHVPTKLTSVMIDLRYRTSENATGRPLYPSNMPCLLHSATIERLATAQRILRQEGYGLKILDAWRPPESHQALWNAVRDPRWVVPPSDGLSMHCYGLAVDVTLVDINGKEQRMPSAYDEFSERAKTNYTGPDAEIRQNVERLQNAMKKAGFRAIPDEWWHFDIPGNTRVFRVNASSIGLKLPQ